MAGELWNGVVQIGKEVSAGTPVAATRRLYVRDPKFTRERAPRPHRFMAGSRDMVRAMTLGPTVVSGGFAMPLSASEIVELLLMGVKGGVSPTNPAGGVDLWTHKPDPALDSATIEWHDGARNWQVAGCRANSLKFSGSVKDESLVTADVFGTAMVAAAATGGLLDRVPDFIEGWETKLYVDAFGGVPGSTNLAGTLINWDITLSNGLARKYFAGNTLDAGGLSVGEVAIDATLTFEAAPAATKTEYDNWDAVTKRLLRLEFGQNEVISTVYKKFVTLDLPGAWSAVDLTGEDEGTRTYQFKLQAIYDSVNAFSFQVRAQNARAAAWV